MSQTPWIVAETYLIENFYETQVVSNGTVKAVARGTFAALSRRRAEYIVRSVNAHAALTEALVEALRKSRNEECGTAYALLMEIDAALKLAEGL